MHARGHWIDDAKSVDNWHIGMWKYDMTVLYANNHLWLRQRSLLAMSMCMCGAIGETMGVHTASTKCAKFSSECEVLGTNNSKCDGISRSKQKLHEIESWITIAISTKSAAKVTDGSHWCMRMFVKLYVMLPLVRCASVVELRTHIKISWESNRAQCVRSGF